MALKEGWTGRVYEDFEVGDIYQHPLGRTVLISTGQVYLVTEPAKRVYREVDSRRALMREPAPGGFDHAQWRYGVGKRAAESVFMSLRRNHGVRGVILRLPVLQGEGDPTLRLWAWLERLLDGAPVLLAGGGTRPTRFLDVADVARLIERLAGGAWPRGALYNLAAPRATSLRRFLALAARAAGVRPRFASAPAATFSRLGLDLEAWPYAGRWSSVLDPSRAKRDLGFTGTPPEDFLPRVVRWHLEHRPNRSHPSYAQRAAECAAVERLRASHDGIRADLPGPEPGIA